MSAKEKIRKEKIKILLYDIENGKENEVTAGLKSLRINGSDETIPLLIEIWNKGVSAKIEKEIISFISDIKSNSSKEILMGVLKNNKFKKIRTHLLSTIWNSSIDYSEFLTDFVKLATGHDLPTTIECLTIIENLYGPFEEQQILDSTILLREFAEKEQKVSDENIQKISLLKEIYQIISTFERRID